MSPCPAAPNGYSALWGRPKDAGQRGRGQVGFASRAHFLGMPAAAGFARGPGASLLTWGHHGLEGHLQSLRAALRDRFTQQSHPSELRFHGEHSQCLSLSFRVQFK